MSRSRAKPADPDSRFASAGFASAAEPPRRGLPAWLASMILHTVLLVAAGVLVPVSNPPSAAIVDRAAGIALVQRTKSRVNYYSEQEATTNSSTSVPTPSAESDPFPSLEESSLSMAASLPSLQDVGTLSGGGPDTPSASQMLQGSRPSRKMSGGGTSTQVFGAQAMGSTFVYVFDRSSSMEGYRGRPLRAAKSELVKSLRDLRSVHQFQIIFYNNNVSVFNPNRPQTPHMMFGTEPNVNLAEAYIQSIVPAGGTRHLEPIQLALGLQPDVIFLLTDAEEPGLSPRQLAQIRRRNRSDTSIYCIEFGSGPFQGGENFLVRLARQNSGQHVYVDVSSLAAEPGS